MSFSRPSNIFATTGTNVSILFIDKSNRDEVILIDGSGMGKTVKEGKNQKTVLRQEEQSKIVSTFNRKESIDGFSIAVGYDDIAERDYSFSAGQHFEVKIEYIEITNEEFQDRLQSLQSQVKRLNAKSEAISETLEASLAKLNFSDDAR